MGSWFDNIDIQKQKEKSAKKKKHQPAETPSWSSDVVPHIIKSIVDLHSQKGTNPTADVGKFVIQTLGTAGVSYVAKPTETPTLTRNEWGNLIGPDYTSSPVEAQSTPVPIKQGFGGSYIDNSQLYRPPINSLLDLYKLNHKDMYPNYRFQRNSGM